MAIVLSKTLYEIGQPALYGGRRGCSHCRKPGFDADADRGLPQARSLLCRFSAPLLLRPLYRQSQILARSGVSIHRSTLADWVGVAAFHLRPVVDRLAERLKASSKLFMPFRQIATQSPAG